MRLTDWVIQSVERDMRQQIAKITIPDNLDFSDLRLARDLDGSVSFDWGVFERVCKASGLPVELSSDDVTNLLVGWYQAHRQHGGDPDPTAEDLIAEVLIEESKGQIVSHKPGRA
jgi:hypothetical protein